MRCSQSTMIRRSLPRDAQTPVPAPAEGSDSSSTLIIAAARRPSLFLKLAITLLLIAAATLTGVLSYRMAHAAQLHLFTIRFQTLAHSLSADIMHSLESKLEAAAAGASLLSTLPCCGDGRGAYVRFFQTNTAPLLNLSQSSYANWVIIVNDSQRATFEANALASAGIRGGGGSILNISGPPLMTPDAPASEYAVIWAAAPAGGPAQAFVMGDLLSDPNRAVAFIQSCKTAGPQAVMSDFIPLNGLQSAVCRNSWNFLAGSPRNTTAPLLPGPEAGDALFLLFFQWEQLLTDELSALEVSNGMAVAITSPSNASYSFLISASGNEGHAGAWTMMQNGMAPQAAIMESAAHTSQMALANGDTWTFTIYPTQLLFDLYVTDTPRLNSIMVSMLIASSCVLFWIYEYLTARRTASLNRALAKNAASLELARVAVLAGQLSSAHKDEFVSMVSHEIRTPLNAVSGAVSVLKSSQLARSSSELELLGILESAGRHIVRVVDDILDHAALNSGEFSISFEPFSLSRQVLEPAMRMTGHVAKDDGQVRTSTMVAPDVPDAIMGDAMRLVQVITNLVSNARKFTPPGGEVSLHVAVGQSSTAQPQLEFAVVDTGIGLSEANLSRIFLPFVQAESTTTRVFGGTGLGLTISKRLAGEMGGQLTAHSEGIGKGTTMRLTLPLHTPPPGAEQPEGSSSPHAASSRASSVPSSPRPFMDSTADFHATPLVPMEPPPHILLAEDNALNQAVMSRLLRTLGCNVVIAADGVQALEAVQAAPVGTFDAILMDLHMPRMGGVECARAILAWQAAEGQPLIPIVALTASCSAEEKARCAAAGMCGHVSKPCRAEHFHMIQEIIRSNRALVRAAAAGGEAPSVPAEAAVAAAAKIEDLEAQ